MTVEIDQALALLRQSSHLITDAELCPEDDDDLSLLEENPFHETATTSPQLRSWLIDAADLLAEPDPGPTPWLVDDLIVDQALIAAVGRWKTTKSYGLLDVCIAVATGRPAFGKLAIPNPGPVVFVNEEIRPGGTLAPPRRALPRPRDRPRRATRPPPRRRERPRQARRRRAGRTTSSTLGRDLRPRLFVFDPLARMKDAEPRRERADRHGRR